MPFRSLDTLQVTKPCSLASAFHEKASFCQVCHRDVLEVSSLTRQEAAAALSGPRAPCIRLVLRNGRPLFREVAAAAAGLLVAAGVAGCATSSKIGTHMPAKATDTKALPEASEVQPR
jgi:hypothetical protein